MSSDKLIKQLQKKEIKKYGDVNQGLGTWNGYDYVKVDWSHCEGCDDWFLDHEDCECEQ